MPKFKKVIRKQAGGASKVPILPFIPVPKARQPRRPAFGFLPGEISTPEEKAMAFLLGSDRSGVEKGVKSLSDMIYPPVPKGALVKAGPVQGDAVEGPDSIPSTPAAPAKGSTPALGSRRAPGKPSVDNQKIASMLMAAAKPSKDLSNLPSPQLPGLNQDAMINALVSGSMGRRRSDLSDLSGRLASMEELGFKKSAAPAPAGMSGMLASAEIPKTKAGMKKFIQE